MTLHVALHEPEIPQNTGNIARSCAAGGADPPLIRPLGFSTDDRYLKRAGLDYWDLVEVSYYDGIDAFLTAFRGVQMVFSSTKGGIPYTQMRYASECCLLFGKETAGLPENLLRDHVDQCVRIPMREQARSLNLSNAAAIVMYEALRQHGFEGLQLEGKLRRAR
jgi:tRNA (cytidine/uridine-2'-O-)-methyltransferase